LFLLYYYDNWSVCIEFDYLNLKIFLLFFIIDHNSHKGDGNYDMKDLQ